MNKLLKDIEKKWKGLIEEFDAGISHKNYKSCVCCQRGLLELKQALDSQHQEFKELLEGLKDIDFSKVSDCGAGSSCDQDQCCDGLVFFDKVGDWLDKEIDNLLKDYD